MAVFIHAITKINVGLYCDVSIWYAVKLAGVQRKHWVTPERATKLGDRTTRR